MLYSNIQYVRQVSISNIICIYNIFIKTQILGLNFGNVPLNGIQAVWKILRSRCDNSNSILLLVQTLNLNV